MAGPAEVLAQWGSVGALVEVLIHAGNSILVCWRSSQFLCRLQLETSADLAVTQVSFFPEIPIS